MTQYLPIVIASAVLALLATPVTRWLAHRLGMVDQPGLRKAHRAPTPLLGGLAIYLGLLLAFTLLGSRDWVAEGVGILGGATLMFITGLWDDRYGMPAPLKLGAGVVAAVFLSGFGVRAELTGNPWLDTGITILWVVGITNAANLMDNMDGLAAGLTAVAAAFYLMMAAVEGQGLVASLAAALLGAALGFLFYNLAPAASFMGDAGSLTIGYMLAVLGLKLHFMDRPVAATWMAPIVVLGVFIFDTSLVTISRLRRGRSPFQGGSDHTSHRLVQLGLSAPRAVLTLYIGAVLLGAAAVLLTRLDPLAANITFASMVLAGLGLLVALERVEPRLGGDPLIVLAPAAGGFAPALAAAAGLSRNLAVLVVPGVTARADVITACAGVADEPAGARLLLERGLGEDWPADLPAASRALRLHGAVLPVEPGQPAAEALAAVRKARLILYGPGAADGDAGLQALLAHRAAGPALREAAARSVWAGPGMALIGEALAVEQPALPAALQRRLLREAAGQAKTA